MLHKSGSEWVKVLRRACLSGRDGIKQNYTKDSRYRVLGRGAGGDLTLKIDSLSESAILKSLNEDLGEDNFVFFSEEMGEREHSDTERPTIICDPLDGSHNAQFGLPIFSISLSVLDLNGRNGQGSRLRRFKDVDFAFTQSVQTEDEYYAIKGGGAFHNRKKIRNSPTSESHRFRTLGVECGDVDYAKKALSAFSVRDIYKLRVLGSAALSFCYVAEGTFDGFLFLQPNGARSIDSAGGYLIAKESGCNLFNLSAPSRGMEDVRISFESRLNVAVTNSSSELKKLVRLVSKGLSNWK
jgi:myo-inositol-1(or 4)-monophosphatase